MTAPTGNAPSRRAVRNSGQIAQESVHIAPLGDENGLSIAVIGCTSVDVLVRDVDALPPPGTDNTVEEISVRAAGPALNVAFVVHALGDGPAVCFGAIGDDPLASMVRDECADRGVPTHGLARRSGERTGVSVALESRTRPRAFLTDLGAAAHLDESLVPDSFAGYSDVLLAGYFVAPGLRGDASARILRRARADGARTWLDPGWDTDSWTSGGADEIRRLLPEVDFFLPNTDEIAPLTGESDPVAGGRELAKLTRVGVVLKAGADGAYWIARDAEPLHVAAPLVPVVDTTGAGDALNAGLIVGLRQGLSIENSVILGVETASTIVGRTSARRWDPLA